MWWIDLGTEVAVPNSHVVPITQVVLYVHMYYIPSHRNIYLLWFRVNNQGTYTIFWMQNWSPARTKIYHAYMCRVGRYMGCCERLLPKTRQLWSHYSVSRPEIWVFLALQPMQICHPIQHFPSVVHWRKHALSASASRYHRIICPPVEHWGIGVTQPAHRIHTCKTTSPTTSSPWRSCMSSSFQCCISSVYFSVKDHFRSAPLESHPSQILSISYTVIPWYITAQWSTGGKTRVSTRGLLTEKVGSAAPQLSWRSVCTSRWVAFESDIVCTSHIQACTL